MMVRHRRSAGPRGILVGPVDGEELPTHPLPAGQARGILLRAILPVDLVDPDIQLLGMGVPWRGAWPSIAYLACNPVSVIQRWASAQLSTLQSSACLTLYL